MTKHPLVIIFPIVIISVIAFYIFIAFPFLDKDMRNEPKTADIVSWESGKSDSITYYYIEYMKKIPGVDKLLEHTVDSIFVVDYLKSHPSSVTLKDPKQTLVHFTNNFSMNTMRCYSYYLKTKDENYLQLFRKNADWIYDNAKIMNDSIALWTNDNMIYDKYNLDYGWPSAYGQGVCLSVLCRAYQHTGNEKYLKKAEQALNSFNLNYKNGGILDNDIFGNYWHLEYPSNPPGYVLNGMIFGLFGLYDYYRITNSTKALEYFERGVNTLERNIFKYDRGYWSAYDLEYHTCAGFNYHKNIHIPQSEVLYQITNKEIFKSYANKFLQYLHGPFLTFFKIEFSLEAIQRRLTYKSPLKKLAKERFK